MGGGDEAHYLYNIFSGLPRGRRARARVPTGSGQSGIDPAAEGFLLDTAAGTAGSQGLPSAEVRFSAGLPSWRAVWG